MSIKIEYICNACGVTGPATKGWIELNMTIRGNAYHTYHCCMNISCMRKVQQQQCNDIGSYARMQKLTTDPDIDAKQWNVDDTNVRNCNDPDYDDPDAPAR